jgi:predicted chitinase
MHIRRKASSDDGAGAQTRSGGRAAGKRQPTDGVVPSDSEGEPLPHPLLVPAQAATGADLTGVRVHDDAAAHESARDFGALAYTFGHDIWFGEGQYNPGTPAGDRLIAHEVAHTVQQGPAGGSVQTKLEVSTPGDAAEREADDAVGAILAGTPASITRDAGAGIARATWDSAYGKDPDPKADAYRDSINTPGGPEMKPMSEYTKVDGKTKGTKSSFHLTRDELISIIVAAHGKQATDYMHGQGPDPDPAKNREHAHAEIEKYVVYCQRAFETMMIDTVESQALFLAHAAGETAFTKLTEGQTNSTNFAEKPSDVKVSTSMASTTGQKYGDGTPIPDGPMRYGQQQNGYRGSVDPTGAIDGSNEDGFDKTFIGRGPIQVTLKENYVQTLMFMEKRAADLRAQAASDPASASDANARATELDEAVAAIKASPAAASDPKYSFLFSAAMMQMSPMGKASVNGFTNTGMTGGYADRQGEKKQKAYAKAVEILTKHKKEDETRAENDRLNREHPVDVVTGASPVA